ncbi:MAG TPA: hypothetical protein VFZ65_20440 [Planctomycetota bacterium]|nr:hypothetical protein [Planctomycetota bacterium]
MLEEFLGREKVAPLFAKGWVDVMIDVDRDTHGKEINERLKGDRSGGLPWMVILDGHGKEIVSSNENGTGGNIGGPRSAPECAWFATMLDRSRGDKLTAGEVQVIAEDLEAWSKPKRK